MTSQIIGNSTVCLRNFTGKENIKAPLTLQALCDEVIHRWPVGSVYKGSVMQKAFLHRFVFVAKIMTETILRQPKYYSERFWWFCVLEHGVINTWYKPWDFIKSHRPHLITSSATRNTYTILYSLKIWRFLTFCRQYGGFWWHGADSYYGICSHSDDQVRVRSCTWMRLLPSNL